MSQVCSDEGDARSNGDCFYGKTSSQVLVVREHIMAISSTAQTDTRCGVQKDHGTEMPGTWCLPGVKYCLLYLSVQARAPLGANLPGVTSPCFQRSIVYKFLLSFSSSLNLVSQAK